MSRERRDSQGGREVVAVGLTGGIGAGKSTGLALFAELGAAAVSADELVHWLYERLEVAAQIGAHFGSGVLTESGAVDRSRLAAAVRGRPDELHFLETVTHPRVAEEIARRVRAVERGRVIVCEVPLLFESGYETLFDLVVTIEADGEVRRRRSAQRFDLEQFAELEALQASREQRVGASDLAYVNNGGMEPLREFVEQAYAVAQGLLEKNVSGSGNGR
jgi:dephospho-CoA kinase